MREDWQRLASLVVRERTELGYGRREDFAEASGISYRTLGDLETGKRVGRRTLTLAEIALRWGPGSAQNILAGGEPTKEPRRSVPATPKGDSANPEILTATPEELVRMRRFLKETRGRAFADQWLLDALQMRDEAEQHMQRPRDAG